jgi:N-acetyl-gamma-glutamyl-phosphate reductase
MESAHDQFLAEVEQFLGRTRMKPSALGAEAINDPSFVTALRRGRSPSLRTIDKVRGWMGAHEEAAEGKGTYLAASMERKRVGILGASGYTGAELVRLLAHHRGAEIVALTASRRAGMAMGDVFPHLGGLDLPRLYALEELDWAGLGLDAVFSALPHGASTRVVSDLLALPSPPRVIDLAADFRLADPAAYIEWYGGPHGAPELLPRAVYGLTEFARADLPGADLIACPGCYPTAALLPLVPLVAARAISLDDIVIDSKSGASGAGRAEKESLLYGEVAEAIHPYALGGHRHAPEIEEHLTAAAAGLRVTTTFVPHLVPMNRGILSTIYVRLADGITSADARLRLFEAFSGEAFVRVLEEGQIPATRMVRGSNHCVLNLFGTQNPGRAVVVSAIDNLVKGASGQAVQNFNAAFGLNETLGLEAEALFP